MKAIRAIVTSALLAIAVLTCGATSPQPPRMWENVGQAGQTSSSAQNIAEEPSPEISVGPDGAVYISLPRRMTVELFTILGQPVSRETLNAGTYRLRLRSRGIYILRAAGMTRRITI